MILKWFIIDQQPVNTNRNNILYKGKILDSETLDIEIIISSQGINIGVINGIIS